MSARRSFDGIPASAAASAIVAALVGFGGTLALVIAAAQAIGATPTQTASWVTAICLAKVFETGFLSWKTKMPVVTAWSTAGLALIAATTDVSINEAVGAYIIAAVLMILTGLIKPLTRLVSRIPGDVAGGMLAGILVSFVIGAAKAVPDDPLFYLPLVALFLLVRLRNPALAAISVLAAGFIVALVTGRMATLPSPSFSTLEFITPAFRPDVMIGLGIPLYLVTMASQNLPGLAVLRSSGYAPPAGLLIGTTGLFSLLSAPFGASTTNLAAITAAMCTGPDCHPDPAKRWLSGPVYAACYLVFAVFGASLVALFAAMPPSLIILVAGLALAAPLVNALVIALDKPDGRFAAIATFAVTASGVSVSGIGSAFWGLVIGLLVAALSTLEFLKRKQ
jgi:benzoate membrane transport protein